MFTNLRNIRFRRSLILKKCTPEGKEEISITPCFPAVSPFRLKLTGTTFKGSGGGVIDAPELPLNTVSPDIYLIQVMVPLRALPFCILIL